MDLAIADQFLAPCLATSFLSSSSSCGETQRGVRTGPKTQSSARSCQVYLWRPRSFCLVTAITILVLSRLYKCQLLLGGSGSDSLSSGVQVQLSCGYSLLNLSLQGLSQAWDLAGGSLNGSCSCCDVHGVEWWVRSEGGQKASSTTETLPVSASGASFCAFFARAAGMAALFCGLLCCHPCLRVVWGVRTSALSVSYACLVVPSLVCLRPLRVSCAACFARLPAPTPDTCHLPHTTTI